MRERRRYDNGTYLDMEFPFGFYLGGRAMCSDGKVRRIHRIAPTADTFFSVPASVIVLAPDPGEMSRWLALPEWQRDPGNEKGRRELRKRFFGYRGGTYPRPGNKRHTVSGFISIDSTRDNTVRFHAHKTGKNYYLLKEEG